MSRYVVTVDVIVDAKSEEEAIDKIQNGHGDARVVNVYDEETGTDWS